MVVTWSPTIKIAVCHTVCVHVYCIMERKIIVKWNPVQSRQTLLPLHLALLYAARRVWPRETSRGLPLHAWVWLTRLLSDNKQLIWIPVTIYIYVYRERERERETLLANSATYRKAKSIGNNKTLLRINMHVTFDPWRSKYIRKSPSSESRFAFKKSLF